MQFNDDEVLEVYSHLPESDGKQSEATTYYITRSEDINKRLRQVGVCLVLSKIRSFYIFRLRKMRLYGLNLLPCRTMIQML